MKSTRLDHLLFRSPLQPMSYWLHRRRLAVLAYHAIENPDLFRAQVTYLCRRMHPVSMDEVLMSFKGKFALPDHAVLVTFDDGDRSVLDVGAQVLKEQGVPGVAFIIAGFIDSTERFWWDEATDLFCAGGTARGISVGEAGALLRAMKQLPDEGRRTALEELRKSAAALPAAGENLRSDELARLESAGIEIANHTFTHPCLPRCSFGTVEEEVRRAHELLSAHLGHSPRAFAYPNGDWDGRAAGLLNELGYEGAFLFDHRLANPDTSEVMRVSRLRVSSSTGPERFQLILSGLHPTIHRILGRS